MEEKKTYNCGRGHDHHDHGHHHEHKPVRREEKNVSCGCHEDGCAHEDHSCSCGHDHAHGGTIEKGELIPLAAALALFFAGLLLPVGGTVQFILYIAAYLISGWKVLLQAGKNITRGHIFDEAFLMSAASIGACLIGKVGEGAAVMLFYNVGELFQSYAVGRSRGSITALMDIRPDTANLLKDGQATQVPAESVQVGEIILVRAGERIPLDGRVVEGNSQLDTAALTGEALPRDIGAGEEVLAGCVNLTGVLHIEVTKPFGESTASKILELTERAGANKAKAERFITKFARYYTPAVVLIAVIIAIFPPLLGLGAWSDFIHRALTFLVISCPCALVISVPMGFFAGIGCASKNGILVKGGNYLEALCDAETVVFDKTGTLTRGKFEVLEVHPNGITEEELVELAALAETHSTHPIARSLRAACTKEPDRSRLGEVTEVAGNGVEAVIDGQTVLAGNVRLMERHGISVPKVRVNGTCIYLARENTCHGYIIIGDAPKPEAKEALKALKTLGVTTTVMLTGDHPSAAEKVGGEVGVDEIRAELLPGDKVHEVEKLLGRSDSKGKLLFIGDGMNDAPVLARADIGVAMGGMGTDAAIEAADVVVMDDDLNRLPTAIRIARHTRTIVIQNVVFALGVKFIILILGAAGHASMWAAVFADVGVSLLAVLNSLRALNIRK